MELSAKDKALCLEREKHRREINELKAIIRSKDKAIASLRVDIYAQQSKIEEQSEWIGRLLEYISPIEQHGPEWKIQMDAWISEYLDKLMHAVSYLSFDSVTFPKGWGKIHREIEEANRRRAWYGPDSTEKTERMRKIKTLYVNNLQAIHQS